MKRHNWNMRCLNYMIRATARTRLFKMVQANFLKQEQNMKRQNIICCSGQKPSDTRCAATTAASKNISSINSSCIEACEKELESFNKAQTVASEVQGSPNSTPRPVFKAIDGALKQGSQKADQFFHRAITPAREEGTIQIALRETKSKIGT